VRRSHGWASGRKPRARRVSSKTGWASSTAPIGRGSCRGAARRPVPRFPGPDSRASSRGELVNSCTINECTASQVERREKIDNGRQPCLTKRGGDVQWMSGLARVKYGERREPVDHAPVTSAVLPRLGRNTVTGRSGCSGVRHAPRMQVPGAVGPKARFASSQWKRAFNDARVDVCSGLQQRPRLC
jgi:hypothetical protein